MASPEAPREPDVGMLAIVRGRVQGVGFRYEARCLARSLGLTGWIRNLPDGGVETLAEGPKPAVARYLTWLGMGPPGASVDSVEASERPAVGRMYGFDVEP